MLAPVIASTTTSYCLNKVYGIDKNYYHNKRKSPCDNCPNKGKLCDCILGKPSIGDNENGVNFKDLIWKD